MSHSASPSEYLVISRGQWDKDASPAEIQKAIDQFYAWIGQMIDAGKMKPGERLARAGRTVTRDAPISDGPFGEAKEAIGGYWFILAESLEEAARLASENPCLQLGLFYEIRPLDPAPATATMLSTETPQADSARH